MLMILIKGCSLCIPLLLALNTNNKSKLYFQNTHEIILALNAVQVAKKKYQNICIMVCCNLRC